jgi:hypothetical protein
MGDGYICYTSVPASEVPAELIWHRYYPRWPGGGILRTEYAWNPGEHPDWKWEGFAGMPWMRTVDTALPEGDPRRITYFRDAELNDQAEEPSG